jgi:hypothetical protein
MIWDSLHGPMSARFALKKVGPAAVPAIAPLLKDDNDPRVVKAAETAVRKIQEHAEKQNLPGGNKP